MKIKQNRRVLLFDELRGIMIISMVIYHLCYDLAEIAALPGMGWFYSPAASLWQISICSTFILIAGACCAYSKSNLKRGIKLLALGFAFTLVTAVFIPDQIIVFGLLHFMGAAVLLTHFAKNLLQRIPTAAGIAACVLLFILTNNLYLGWIGFTPQLSIELPSWLYSTNLLCFLGFYSPSFYSSDYFPLLPYIFLFWAGTFAQRLSLPQFFYNSHCKPLAFLGRNSLWIYLFHQPLLYLAVCLIWMN